MLLSFLLCAILILAMVVISLTDKRQMAYEIPQPIRGKMSKLVVGAWALLSIIMVGLYVVFN